MKLKIFFLLVMLIIIPTTVSATTTYYVNDNGVCLSKKEYDYLVEKFDEKFPTIITKSDYEKFIVNGFFDKDLKSYVVYSISPLDYVSHQTKSKALKMTASCKETYCVITVVLDWTTNPKIRSWDVIGAYFSTSSLKTEPTTWVVSEEGTDYSYEISNQSHGFGVSIKLPDKGESITIYQSYTVNPKGIVYASYQHATSSISLANSKKYTINLGGYGNVFNFESGVREKYDAMSGVYITL